jgi:hypothetical protein
MAAKTPLLQNQITQAEMVMLGHLAAHPGYAIFERLLRATVDEANAAVLKTEPADPNYNRLLAARQQEARATNLLAEKLLRSISTYSRTGAYLAQTDEQKASQRVAAMLADLKNE